MHSHLSNEGHVFSQIYFDIEDPGAVERAKTLADRLRKQDGKGNILSGGSSLKSSCITEEVFLEAADSNDIFVLQYLFNKVSEKTKSNVELSALIGDGDLADQ